MSKIHPSRYFSHAEARTKPFAGHSLASLIRHDAAETVKTHWVMWGQAFWLRAAPVLATGPPSHGISVFDPAVTTSATHGYYVVYLFAGAPVVHVSLNQGTTSVREEFGARAREILRDRADLMRKRVVEFADALPIRTIELGSNTRLPGGYVAGHALGTTYTLSALPDEAQLRSDLQMIVRAYRALTYRGGIDADAEGQTDLADEFGISPQTSITETRKYAYHRKIERNRTSANHAKKFHYSVSSV